MHTILSTFFISCFLLFTCYGKEPLKLPCSRPEDKAAIFKIVKKHLAESDIPEPLKKNISVSTIKGYEVYFPHRLVVFRNNSHIVTLKQSVENGEPVYSLAYAHRGSIKTKSKLLNDAITEHKQKVKELNESRHMEYKMNGEFSSQYSLYEIPLKYINKLNAKRMWSREEVQKTFPDGMKRLERIPGDYFIYLDEDFIALMLNKYPHFTIHPLRVNESTILAPRKWQEPSPSDDNYLIIPESMKAALQTEGTLQKAQIIARELNKRLANAFLIYTMHYKKLNDVDNAYGKILDRPLIVFGEIPSIEKHLTALEISVMREIGYYFNSILDLQKAGLKVEISAFESIKITNEKGQILYNQSSPGFFITYRSGNLITSTSWRDRCFVVEQLKYNNRLLALDQYSVGGSFHHAYKKRDDQKMLNALCEKWNRIINLHNVASNEFLNCLDQSGYDVHVPILPGQFDPYCYDIKKFANEVVIIGEDYKEVELDDEKLSAESNKIRNFNEIALRKTYNENSD